MACCPLLASWIAYSVVMSKPLAACNAENGITESPKVHITAHAQSACLSRPAMSAGSVSLAVHVLMGIAVHRYMLGK